MNKACISPPILYKSIILKKMTDVLCFHWVIEVLSRLR